MPTRAENLRNQAEECVREARRAGSATAIFVLLDIAEDLKRQARQAEQEDEKAAGISREPPCEFLRSGQLGPVDCSIWLRELPFNLAEADPGSPSKSRHIEPTTTGCPESVPLGLSVCSRTRLHASIVDRLRHWCNPLASIDRPTERNGHCLGEHDGWLSGQRRSS